MDAIPNMWAAIFTLLFVFSLFLGSTANGVDPNNCTSLCDFHRHFQIQNATNQSSCTFTVSIQPSWAIIENGSFRIKRSESLWLSSRVTLNGGQCPHINSFIWRWTVYSEEASQTIVISTHDNGPYMLLKGNDLWYGHYTVNTTLLSNNYEVTQTPGPLSQLRFTVYPTPLVVRIDGGDFRTIPQDTVVEFDASGTYDPDGLITPYDMKFYWYCLCSRSVAYEASLNFSDVLNYTGPKLVLREYENRFDTNVTVRVVAVGTGNEVVKEGEATQKVEIRRGVAPLVHFKCLYNCGNPNVSTAEKLVLQMSCFGCKKAGEVVWGWEIILSAITLYNNGSTGSILPGKLAGGTTYELCAYGKFPHHPEHLSYMARVCMQVRTSKVNSTGTCEIFPRKGVSLLTPFKVICSGTEPGSLIEVYQLFKHRSGNKENMLRYQYDPVIDNVFLFADNNELHMETVKVNIVDADYTRVSTFELLVTVLPFTGHMCENDFLMCVRELVLKDMGNRNVSFLEELASRGDQQGALHVGLGLLRMMVKMVDGRNSWLLEKVQLALLRLSSKLRLDSIPAVKQITNVLEGVLRATWPKIPSPEVVSLALDVGLKTSDVIADLAKEDMRPIYNRIIEMTQLLMEALGGVCDKGAWGQTTDNETESAIRFSNDNSSSDTSNNIIFNNDTYDVSYDDPIAEMFPVDRSLPGSRVIENILREITDTLAESVAVHKFEGETLISIHSTCMYLTIVRGLYGELAREIKRSPLHGFGWHKDVRQGFVRFGSSKALHNVSVTVHLVEYLMRSQSLRRIDDVTTRVMELRVKRDDAHAYMTNVGPVDYYLYTQDNMILQWSGPLPLRAKLPQDYTPEDISSHKGSLAPDVREPFEVAVLARAEDTITALEVRINSKSIPNLDAFSLYDIKPAPTNVSHPVPTPFDPVQYVMYVPEDMLKEKATYYVGVLPFRNVSFRSFYHFETTKYALSMQSAACYDMGSVDFYKKGSTNCRVIKGQFTSLWSVACRCSPGSTRVGASLRAIKLHEDKPTVQLFLLISSNPSAMAFLGGIMISYIVILLLAWIVDRKLQHKCGVTILRDSDPAYSKQYLAVVYTGGGWHAGTSARIAVRFNGLTSSSDIHVLTNTNNRHFSRGGEDRFLFSTARSLGCVTSVDVWTDLTGPSPDWFLHKIVLVDPTQKDTWDFLANKWFGKPEEEDGDVLLTSMTIRQQTERDKFRSLLIWKIMKGFHNDHLWLSVLFRWPGSSFKCVHRVTALLVLVLFASFINLALRGLPAENTRRLLVVQPQHTVTLLESDLCSAFLGTCILIIVQMFFIQLLRKLWQGDKWKTEVDIDENWPLLTPPKQIPEQPSHQTVQNVDKVSEEKIDETVVEFVSVVIADGCRKTGYDLKLERKTTKETLITNSERTVVSNETVAVPSEQTEMPDGEENDAEQEVCEDDEEEESPEEMKERKENEDSQHALREWINGLTWVTLAVISLTLLGVNMVYGLRMTVDLTKVWVLSTVISLGFSAFIFEPLVVVAIAAIGASRGQEKMFPKVGWRSDSLTRRDQVIRRDGTHDDYRRYLVRLRKETPVYNETVSRSAKKRPRHIERHDRVMVVLFGKIFSFVGFVVFLWALMLEVREDLSYYSTTTANQLTVLNSFTSQKHLDSAKVFDTKSFYKYLRFNLVPALQPDNMANLPKIEAGAKLPWTATGSTFTLGAIRMRQLRSARVRCPVEFMTNMSYTIRDQELAEGNCIPAFSKAVEETMNFGRGWSLFMADSTGEGDVWTYKDASKAPAMSAYGKILTYPAGGYVANLGATHNDSLRIIDYLMTNNWVDRSTRAVIIEMSTWSPFVNLLSTVQLVFEFPPLGGAFVSSYVDSFRPVHYLGYTRPGVLFCYGSIIVFCIVLAAIEAQKFLELGRFYFHNGWNLVNLAIVVLSYVYLACIFTSFGVDSNALAPTTEQDALSVENQDELRLAYFDPSSTVQSNRLGTMILVILGTVSMAKLWKMLSFNRHMHGFVLTLRYCMAPLSSFLVTFVVVYMAFASYAHVLFGDMDRDMRTIGSTLGCMFFSTIGSVKFQLQNNRGSDVTRIGRIIFFTLFVFIVFVYMVSVFVSIILRSFNKGSERKGRMRNRYEILNFIIAKVYSTFGKDYPEGYRQCLDAVRESHLAELMQSADRMEKMAGVARKAVRYLGKMSVSDRRSLRQYKSHRV